jgi:hypothetical protein
MGSEWVDVAWSDGGDDCDWAQYVDPDFGCPERHAMPVGMSERRVREETRTERIAGVAPRQVLTVQAGTEVTRQVGQLCRSVASVAVEYGVGWDTAWAAVELDGSPLVNPLFRTRKLLLRGDKRLDERGRDKMMAGLRFGDPHDEVPEIRTLGHTLSRWRGENLNLHRTGASNGPTRKHELLRQAGQESRPGLHELRPLQVVRSAPCGWCRVAETEQPQERRHRLPTTSGRAFIPTWTIEAKRHEALLVLLSETPQSFRKSSASMALLGHKCRVNSSPTYQRHETGIRNSWRRSCNWQSSCTTGNTIRWPRRNGNLPGTGPRKVSSIVKRQGKRSTGVLCRVTMPDPLGARDLSGQRDRSESHESAADDPAGAWSTAFVREVDNVGA